MFSKFAKYFKFFKPFNKTKTDEKLISDNSPVIISEVSEEEYKNKSIAEKVEKNINNISISAQDEETSTPITNADLSTRTINCLVANGIDTIEKLPTLNLAEFKTKKNVGQKTIDEIEKYIDECGYYEPVFRLKEINSDIKNTDVQKDNSYSEIDENIYNLDFSQIDLPAKLKDKLKNENIKNIGEFLKNINNSNLKNKEIENIYSYLNKYGIQQFKNYVPVHVEIPQNYFYKITDIFNDEWIIDACQKYGIKNVGLLANVFPDIFVQNDELVNQEIFFEKIAIIENKLKELGINKTPIKLSYFQEKELLKKDVSELLNRNHLILIENLITNLLFKTFENNESKKRSQLNERELDILKRRYGIGCDKQTLEEIGQLYECTRERIRQLENNSIKKIINLITPDFQIINEEIEQLLNGLGSMIFQSNSINIAHSELIDFIIQKIEYRCFDIDFENNLIIKKGFNIQDIFEQSIKLYDNSSDTVDSTELKNIFEKSLIQKLFNNNETQNYNYNNIFDNLFLIFQKKYFVKIDNNLYKPILNTGRRSTQERNEKLLYWLEKLYPNGIHLPIEKEKETQVLQDLQPLIEKCPEIQNKAVRYIVSKIKEYKDIVWWGRGLYIHINNVNPDWSVVDEAISEILNKFNNGLYRLKPKAIFDENKNKFHNANIPNEYALLGLIKYKNNPRINILRSEIRDNENSNLELSILEAFENYILQNTNGVTTDELIEELCNKRGWKPHQIAFLYNRSNSIYCDDGTYYHKNNFTVNDAKLSELINIMQNELNSSESAFLHLRKIRNKYPENWFAVINKDISPNFMGRLLSPKLSGKDIVVDNYIYVKKEEHFNESVSYLSILDKFVEEKSLENKVVTFPEISEFCLNKGLKDTKYIIVDLVAKFAFEYANEVYVHNNVLGYSDEFQEDLFALMQIISKSKFESPIIKYDDVISKYGDLLPSLNEGYEWNRYLLRSALKINENIDTFDKTFIFKENRFGVEDLDDTAAFLMVKNFENGYCEFKELDRLMAEYGVTPEKCLHWYKSRLFFEGSSIRSAENDMIVVEQFALDKYRNK